MLMNIYRKINRDQFQFDFVCVGDEHFDYQDEVLNLGGRLHRIPNETNKSLKKRYQFCLNLFKSNPGYNIAHSHLAFNSAYILLAAKLANVKTRISHSHCTNEKCRNTLPRIAYRSLSRAIFPRVTTNALACGLAASRYLYGRYHKNAVIIKNGIDIESFAINRQVKREFFRSKILSNEKQLILSHIGSLNKNKNQTFSLSVAKELKSKGVDFLMLFVGTGEDRSYLEKLTADYSLTQNVKFLGTRSDLPDIYAGSDFVLLPSFNEGFPLVLVEAQAAGVPAIISSTISKEVDLQVGCISFHSTENGTSSWTNAIINGNYKSSLDNEARIRRITSQGFDISTSKTTLVNIYDNQSP